MKNATPSAAGHKHDFPLRYSLKGHAVALRPLTPSDRDALVTLARALPEEDLLFLQRDMTQPGEVEAWIRESAQGSLTTLVAWEGDTAVGYATFDRGTVRWMRHVAEVRVVVVPQARGLGLGRLLLELVFEMALEAGVTKVIARMTPDQTGAHRLFKRLGFEEEAVLREHALDAHGLTHDLLVLSFHARRHPGQRCAHCGVPVLSALVLDGAHLCSVCYEARYQELGGEG